MICSPCKDASVRDDFSLHKKCKGKTHCDCQHRRTIRLSDGRIASAEGSNEFEGREAGG